LKQKQERIEEQRVVREFGTFLKKADDNVVAGSDLGLFIKRKLDWRTVDDWIKEMKNGKSVKQIWEGLSEPTRDGLRDQLEHLT